jgi:hypothetical protein
MILSSFRSHALCRHTGQFLHAAYFRGEYSRPTAGKPVGLPVASRVLFHDSFDPSVFEQSPQRTVKCSGAHLHASVAQLLDVFEDRVSVTGFGREAEQDEEHRFGNRERRRDMTVDDMSHSDILSIYTNPVKQR